MECDDLKGFSIADERHQREWREWFEKTFDKDGNLIEDQTQPKPEKKKEETFGF